MIISSIFLDRYDNRFLTHVYSADDLSRLVKDSVEYYERKADSARKQAQKTREEVRADTINEYESENRILKNKLKYAVVVLGSDLELERYKQFIAEHENCGKGYKIDSGRFPYVKQFGTGIGISTTVICPICGAEYDITDTSNW